jgi:hypothetical protein
MTRLLNFLSCALKRTAPGQRHRRWAALAIAAGLAATGAGAAATADPVAMAAAPTRFAPIPASAGVRQEGRHWVLEARATPRAVLATRLAQLSGSTIHESPALLERLPPLTRHWRGHSLAEAWQQVLGPDVSHAIHCGANRCRVWIAGVTTPADRRPSTAAPGATPAVSPPVRTGITQAVHSESPTTLPGMPQPDPPGLFPAD